VGYHKPEIQQRMQTAYALRIALRRAGGAKDGKDSAEGGRAEAQVVRLPLKTVTNQQEGNVSSERQWAEERALRAGAGGESKAGSEGVERVDGCMTLLNVAGAGAGTRLFALAALLVRLESLSHVLVWSRTPPAACTPGAEVSIDLVRRPPSHPISPSSY
jgi:hypothetical protein